MPQRGALTPCSPHLMRLAGRQGSVPTLQLAVSRDPGAPLGPAARQAPAAAWPEPGHQRVPGLPPCMANGGGALRSQAQASPGVP